MYILSLNVNLPIYNTHCISSLFIEYWLSQISQDFNLNIFKRILELILKLIGQSHFHSTLQNVNKSLLMMNSKAMQILVYETLFYIIGYLTIRKN